MGQMGENKISKAQIIYEPRNQFSVKELIKLAGIKRSSLFKMRDTSYSIKDVFLFHIVSYLLIVLFDRMNTRCILNHF